MAFDGIVISNICNELNQQLINARISKIAQPEADALLLTLKTQAGQKRLFLSANASLPLVYLTEDNRQAPMTAPNFCMLLRKHIGGGRIVSIEQPGFERVLVFTIEHLNDMGDLCTKTLNVEIMGKHSNIIFCDDEGMILDGIKHISGQVSSVREVLPGRTYFIPAQEGKDDPLQASKDNFTERVSSRPMSVCKAIYSSYTGISPIAANEFCYRAGIDADAPAASLSPDQIGRLSEIFFSAMDEIRKHHFSPAIWYEGSRPVEFASLPLTLYGGLKEVRYESISALICDYFSQKEAFTRIRQKSADLRHIVTTLTERARKKYALQMRQLADTDKRDKYRKYGQMIQTYGWQLKEGCSGFEEIDFETGEPLKVPLDRTLTPMENAQKYFERYGKLKRTFEALTVQTAETKEELEHLESIGTALDIAENEADLAQIREELAASGYIRRQSQNKKKGRQEVSRPFHYRSSDGFDIYVGKNNLQNDQLTMKMAQGNDWWFHAKGMPGSHVLVKCPDGEMPDRTFEEAASLAAYYSAGREADKVEIDYLQKKNVKKPNGSKPGYVIYYTNYSMTISPDISGLEKIND